MLNSEKINIQNKSFQGVPLCPAPTDACSDLRFGDGLPDASLFLLAAETNSGSNNVSLFEHNQALNTRLMM